MEKIARVIIGRCDRTGSEVYLCRIFFEKNTLNQKGDKNYHFALYGNEYGYLTGYPNTTSFLEERKITIAELVVGNVNNEATRAYIQFEKKEDIWLFEQGVALEVNENGSFKRVSVSRRGIVVFDSDNLLDFLSKE